MTQLHYIDRGLVDDLQQCFDQRISCAAASPCASVTGGDTVYVELATLPAELLKRAIEALSRPMEAVAWRVKDYADGWILFHHEAPARKSGEARNGALVQALAVIPTEGLGSSLRDTHRAEDRAVVGEETEEAFNYRVHGLREEDLP